MLSSTVARKVEERKIEEKKISTSSVTTQAFEKVFGQSSFSFNKNYPGANPTHNFDPDSTTTNSCAAYSSTGDARLDLFFRGCQRKTSVYVQSQLLEDSWNISPENTVQILLNARNIRGGKGEKCVVFQGLLWLRANKPGTYLLNLAEFLRVGCFKDLLQLVGMMSKEQDKYPKLGIQDEFIELELMAEFLKSDMEKLDVFKTITASEMSDENEEGKKKQSSPRLSLAAKWAPSEGSHFDREHLRFAKRLAKLLFPAEKYPLPMYRKTLSSLRKQLFLTETAMCAKQWDKINYNVVPSRAAKLLKKAFQKNDSERYSKYLEDCKSGKAKINTAAIFPHEICAPYVERCHGLLDATIEVQWESVMKRLREQNGGRFTNAVALVDVSSSMSGLPMKVAVSLGLIVSELSDGPFRGRCISFHEEPFWHVIKGSTLREKTADMLKMDWGGSTCIDKVFDLIVDLAVERGASQEDLPSTLFVFSDMEFNDAFGAPNLTAFQAAKQKFEKAGYKLPHVVFWNLNGHLGSIPVKQDERGVSLMSGYSPDMMKTFVETKEDFSPMSTIFKCLEDYVCLIHDQERCKK